MAHVERISRETVLYVLELNEEEAILIMDLAGYLLEDEETDLDQEEDDLLEDIRVGLSGAVGIEDDD